MLTDRVGLQKLGRDPRGAVSILATSADVPALVQGRSESMTDRSGREVEARFVVFLAPDAPFDSGHDDWRVEWDGREWDVAGYDKETDAGSGAVHHLKLFLR